MFIGIKINLFYNSLGAKHFKIYYKFKNLLSNIYFVYYILYTLVLANVHGVIQC